MPARLRFLLAVLVAALAAAPASASAAGWRCEASALDAVGVAPVTAGGLDRACATDSGSATGLAAATSYANGVALAVGGVSDYKVQSLPTLPVAVPTPVVPDSLGAVVVPLPTDPLLPLLPSSITVDLRPAVQALLPTRVLPTLDLLNVKSAVAYAAGQCASGKPQLTGVSQVSGLKVGGTDVSVGSVVDQTITLLDSGAIDLEGIDVGLVDIPSVVGIADSVLHPIVRSALQPVLDTLPDIVLPAALAQVTVTPGAQTRSGGVLTQQALKAKVSVLGTTIADLAIGTARVADTGVDCSVPATEAEAALGCTRRKLVLVDVLPRNGRVRLVGAADRSLAGRTVRIVFGATGRTVAHALIKPSGIFRTTAPLPAKRLRRTDLARYRAVLGRQQSLNLKLFRRMRVHSTKVSGRRITISGRVLGVLAKPRRMIVVKRRTSCTRMETVARVRPRRDGRFTVSFRAPRGQVAPVYRLQTRVRFRRTSRTTNPTFTLPRPINVG